MTCLLFFRHTDALTTYYYLKHINEMKSNKNKDTAPPPGLPDRAGARRRGPARPVGSFSLKSARTRPGVPMRMCGQLSCATRVHGAVRDASCERSMSGRAANGAVSGPRYRGAPAVLQHLLVGGHRGTTIDHRRLHALPITEPWNGGSMERTGKKCGTTFQASPWSGERLGRIKNVF